MASDRYWMAGKSIRAQQAEADGRMTASALSAWARRFRRFRGCTAADVAAAMAASEWHHTSKFFNNTNYYDPVDLGGADLRIKLAARIAERKAAAALWKSAEKAGLVCDGEIAIHIKGGELWHHVKKSEVARYADRLRLELERGFAAQE